MDLFEKLKNFPDYSRHCDDCTSPDSYEAMICERVFKDSGRIFVCVHGKLKLENILDVR